MRAEAIVAPGGILIADPKARNRAINAAYANLWLKDPRFQWAGLAAFASKQVGVGCCMRWSRSRRSRPSTRQDNA